MSSLDDHMPKQPATYTPTGLTARAAAEVENQSSGICFKVSESTKTIPFHFWESSFYWGAFALTYRINNAVWKDRYVWIMIIWSSFSTGRQAFRLVHEFWPNQRAPAMSFGVSGILKRWHGEFFSDTDISFLDTRVFASPGPMLGFIIIACIDETVWKDRFVCSVGYLVAVHTCEQSLQTCVKLSMVKHLSKQRTHTSTSLACKEPCKPSMASTIDQTAVCNTSNLNDHRPKQPACYAPIGPTALLMSEMENQSFGACFRSWPTRLPWLALFFELETLDEKTRDLQLRGLILAFTFYTARQVFQLFRERWTAESLSQQHVPSFMILDLVDIYPNSVTSSIRKAFFSLSELNMPLSLLACIIMTFMDKGFWRDSLVPILKIMVCFSSAQQLTQLAIPHRLVELVSQQRASSLTCLASNPTCKSSMASTIIRSAGPSSAPEQTHDVFLSFHGNDSRNSFSDHLYVALKQGRKVFRDDKNIEEGTYIFEELLKAIQSSECAVVVISMNFASSKWCLLELTTIMKCANETRLKVFPVFYHVNPADVRKQEGSFGEAFEKHLRDTRVDEGQEEDWTNALKEVGRVKGWHVDANRSEAEVVEEICIKVSNVWSRNL